MNGKKNVEKRMEIAARKDFVMKDAGTGFMLAVLVSLGAQFLLAIIWQIGTLSFGWPEITEVQKTSFAFLIVSGFGLQVLLCLFYLLYTKYNKIYFLEAPRIKNMPARNWLLSAAAGVTALFGLMFTSFAFSILFTDVFGYKTPDVPGFDTAGRAVIGVIFMGIFPAVIEELIFRGMILNGLRGLGRTKAVLISAAAFSLMHMSPAQTVHQFLLGVIMALLAWETGSILAPMLIHFLNNALSIILEVSGFFTLFEEMLAWEIVVTALVTFCAVCGIIYLITRFIKKPAGDGIQSNVSGACGSAQKSRLRDNGAALGFLLAGFIITGVMWIVAMIA